MLCVLVRDVEMRRLDKLENVELRLSDYEFKLVSWRRNDLVNRLKKADGTLGKKMFFEIEAFLAPKAALYRLSYQPATNLQASTGLQVPPFNFDFIVTFQR
ncbi:hypothetical protein BT69DRAFT_1341211 [Atractiella rhizophila]|nr:hypothetical protein BT69DRAFT_1341211 [Atractiella rhizophila]